MPDKLRGLFLVLFLSCNISATHIVQTTKADGNQLNIIVWVCPDADLYKIVEYAIQQHDNVDAVTYSILEQVVNYRSLLWSVHALIYTRATADLMPIKRATTRNLCFVSVPQENFVVYVAAIATDL